MLLLVLSAFSLAAQNFTDALRYSEFTAGGTARAIGAGSAMGALGTDFSVLSTNPAGLGWYRSSEFVLSPGINNARTDSRLTNDEDAFPFEENRSKFNLNTFGAVFAAANSTRDWRTTNFGIGVNRLADFHQNFYFEGSSAGSIVDRFREQANSVDGISDFESGLAIDVGALYENNPPDGLFYSDFQLAPEEAVFRRQDVFTTGAINELVFSFAGNYQDRLLLGATVGVPIVRYSVEKEYREADPGNMAEGGNIPFFNALSYNESISTSGSGINLKLGLIYRAAQNLRVGFAAHTPTMLRLTEVFTSSMGYNFTESGETFNFVADSPDGRFEYRLVTPWRLIGSAGLIINQGSVRPAAAGSDLKVRTIKGGFLSAELEYLNFGNNEFRYEGFGDLQREANQGINDALGAAWNLRLGGEYASGSFRLRGGYGFRQSPLIDDDTINGTLSLGAGINTKSFFLDFAYRRRAANDGTYVPYRTLEAPEQLVAQNATFTQLVLTVGFKWF